MPSKPRTAARAAAQLTPAASPRPRPRPKAKADDDDIQGWDEYVADASPDIEPFRKRMPDGRILEVGCPNSDEMDALTIAMQQQDSLSMLTAIFHDDAAYIAELTAKLPFTVRVRLCNDVMMHFGMSLGQLPESDASPR